MGYYDTFARRLAHGRDALVDLIVRACAAPLTNRGLAVGALLACVILAMGPWLRPAVSPDLRGGHIPWGASSDEWFLPEEAMRTPRPWRWDGIAVPLITIASLGAMAVVMRPRSQTVVFGLLLAMSIPTSAAVLWNHPAMVEFFDAEVRGRRLLRTVFRAESRDLLVGDSPDRLARRWGPNSPSELLPSSHPVLMPFRYAMYGHWLIAISAVGVAVTTAGPWTRRARRVAAYGAVGVLVALAVTAPRWRAEYHVMWALEHETANRFEQAEASLDRAAEAMPNMTATRRYWRDRGRLAYRQGRDDRFRIVFEAHQLGLARRFDAAVVLLRDRVDLKEGDVIEHELLAEFLGEAAARDAMSGNFKAAEEQWILASELAPYTPIYWFGACATALWGDPGRAEEVEGVLMRERDQVGDRVLNSDLASLIGDAYFHRGDFKQAREMYAVSLANFNLPKHVNLRAQYGRLGM